MKNKYLTMKTTELKVRERCVGIILNWILHNVSDPG